MSVRGGPGDERHHLHPLRAESCCGQDTDTSSGQDTDTYTDRGDEHRHIIIK